MPTETLQIKCKEKKGGLWEYLDSIGILERGSDEEIKKAKKEYRKKYLLEYKRNQRKSYGEFAVLLSKKNGEYGKVKSAAERHRKTITTFLKASALAYIDKKYIVPNADQVAKLEQLLMQILNEIHRIARKERDNKYELLKLQIQNMQRELSKALRHPPEITNQHDCENKNTQETELQKTL